VNAPELVVIDDGPDAQAFTKLRAIHDPPLAVKLQGDFGDLDGKSDGKGDKRFARRAKWDCDEESVATDTTGLALHLPVAPSSLPAEMHRKFQRDANAGTNPDFGDLSHSGHPNFASLA